MKTFAALLSVSVLLVGAGLAETPVQTKERVQIKNETQNRFRNMNTDELLQQRGQMHSQQEREQLHNELMNRENTMTKEQKEKFSRVPEKVSQEMGTQGRGMGYGQGQGMMQGQHKGQGGGMGSGMGGGKGGR